MIFCCVLLRRDNLIEVGGIDTTLPGGDDFDMSIRMKKAGKKILIAPECFLIHHAFKTGTRVKGDHTKPMGWNSQEMSDNTNRALIQKHGFKTWLDLIMRQSIGT